MARKEEREDLRRGGDAQEETQPAEKAPAIEEQQPGEPDPNEFWIKLLQQMMACFGKK